MTTHSLTIEFPGTARIPRNIGRDQDLLRYAVAGTLYTRGIMSEKEARRLTGDSEQVFEEKLKEYGFLHRPPARHTPSEGFDQNEPEKKGRWALAAEFFASEEAGHLDGRSDEVKEYIREFRESFEL